MFNMKNHRKESQVTSEEKYLREKNIGPKADDGQPIWEKSLKHREDDKYTITEDQLTEEVDDKTPIIEKVLNEAQGKYIDHRNDATWLSVPPLAAFIEKTRQDRVAKDWKPEKTPHWSHTFNEKKQQGALPKWRKNAPQHEKIVLNNDPSRFTGVSSDMQKGEKGSVKPLIGGITTADIDEIAYQIKTGASVDYDTAIVAILRQADQEKRELSAIEQKSVADLKVSRTKALLKNAKNSQ